LVVVVALFAFPAFASSAFGASVACPNGAIRAEQHSTGLPDCRAWEMVSPVDKNNSDIYFASGTVHTAPEGDRASFVSSSSFASGGGGAPRVSDYLARRSSSGWSTRNISPSGASDVLGAQLDIEFGFRWLSPDLSKGVFVRNDDPGIDRNLYLQNFDDGSTARVSPPMLSALDPFAALFAWSEIGGASRDGRHLLFESLGRLTPDAPEPNGLPKLYEWFDGQVRLVGILPADEGGGPALSSVGGRGILDRQRTEPAMSDDGSRVYFTVPDSTGSLGAFGYPGEVYLRENGSTTHVSTSRRTDCAGDPTCGGNGVPDPALDPDGPGRVRFDTASSDGSVAFLQTCRKLTDDSPASCVEGGGDFREDLYRYDVDSGLLESLTAGTATSVYRVIDASEDGKYVYFIDDQSVAYVWHAGVLTEVGNAFTNVGFNASPKAYTAIRSSRISDDGRYLVYERGAAADDDHNQLYLYDAQSDSNSCVSCEVDGINDGGAHIVRFQRATLAFRQGDPRAMDAGNSRIFFQTDQSLVSADVNGDWDLYQYDVATGERSLISSGTKDGDVELGDITPDGSSVFFVTSQQLVASDTDDLRDLYVARVDGGFPEPSPTPPPCRGDECHEPTPGAPGNAGPGSASFVGPGRLDAVSRRACDRLRTRASTMTKRARRAAGKEARRLRKRAVALRKQAGQCAHGGKGGS
jgi:hypothetical protein